MLPFSDEVFVSSKHRTVEQSVFDEAAVDEQELLPARFSRRIGLAHEPFDRHHIRVFVHGNKPFVVFGPQNSHDALAQRAWLELEQVGVLVGQREGDAGMGKRHALKLVHHMPHFHRIRLQEIPSCRDVVKQVLDVEGGAKGPRLGRLSHHF